MNAIPTVPEIGELYLFFCSPTEDGLAPIPPTLILYNPFVPTTTTPPLVSSLHIREQAEAFFEIPEFTPKFSPEAKQITGLETWFWTDGSLDEVGTVASLGGTTVEIRATYIGTEVIVGELDNTLDCLNQGPWSETATSDCVYTYATESPGRAVEVINAWEFDWWQNGVFVDTYKTEFHSQTDVLEVADLEAVIRGDG